MPAFTHVPNKLVKDRAVSKFESDQYYDGLNFRTITQDGLSTYSIENEKGNSILFRIPDTKGIYELSVSGYTNISIKVSDTVTRNFSFNLSIYSPNAESLYNALIYDPNIIQDMDNGYYNIIYYNNKVYVVGLNSLEKVTSSGSNIVVRTIVPKQNNLRIIGLKNVRDYIVVFTTSESNTSLTPLGTYGQIWKFKLDVNNNIINGNDKYLVPSEHLVYNNTLNVSIYTKITDITEKYYDENVCKIYWIDDINNIRHINIFDSKALILPPDQLEFISNVNLTKPKLVSVTNGGLYKSGVVQYAYNLYNNNGSETAFSPTTELIPLYNTGSDYSNSVKVIASEEDDDVNKSVTITINNLDTRFDIVRVVAIYYPTSNAVPEINIVEERYIPQSGSITVRDDGSKTMGILTTDEFVSTGILLFKPNSITKKDNYLLAGGITEDVWDVDWDARTYRFLKDGSGTLITHQGTTYQVSPTFTIDSNGQTISIPEKFDCTQLKEDQYSEDTPTLNAGISNNTNLAYNLDGELGGSGPNIKYRFKITQSLKDVGSNKSVGSDIAGSFENAWILDYPYLDNLVYNNSFANYASPLASSIIGYQRDEVYRFGIVLIDSKGRKAPVKWIGDIKFPAMWESDAKDTYFDSVYGINRQDFSLGMSAPGNILNVLFIEFEVNNLPTEVAAYEIVRVKRESYDRTIMAQGLLNHTVDDGDFYRPVTQLIKVGLGTLVSNGSLGGLTTTDETSFLLDFQSPEVNFGESIGYGSVQIAGLYPRYDWPLYQGDYTSYESESPKYFFKPTHVLIPEEIQFRSIVEGRKLSGSYGTEHEFGLSKPYKHYTGVISSSYKGTSSVLLIDENFSTFIKGSTYTDYEYALANITIARPNQYGGNSYSDRGNNIYMSTGAYYNVQGSPVPVFGGDTYVGYFEYLRVIYDKDQATAYQEICYIPVESKFNLDIRKKCYHNYYASYLLQETAGSYTNGSDELIMTNDLYDLNLVYSKQSDIQPFIPLPDNFVPREVFDTRITNSEKHINSINGIDYWTKFLFNNYIDIESSYGKITKLEWFKNIVLVFQVDALGRVSINERETVTSSTGASVSIGTGGVLSRYDYITNTSGTLHKSSVVNTGEAVHFFDIKDKKWYRFTGENVEPISVTKEVSSQFRNTLDGQIREMDNTLYGYGIHGVYDKDNLRVIMTFLNGSEKYTMVFGESKGWFEPLLSFTPELYLGFDDKVLSIYPHVYRDNLNDSCWLHGVGDYCNFYNTIYDSYITLVPNPNYDEVKIFANIEFDSECSKNGEDVFNETFTSIRATNRYQDSGKIDFIQDDTLRRRMRQWWGVIPRDGEDTWMRSQYLMLTLYYNNLNNNRLVVHNINTLYN